MCALPHIWEVVSVPLRLSDRLEVTSSMARRAIDRLESLDAISLVGEARRNGIYYARDILEAWEDSLLSSDD